MKRITILVLTVLMLFSAAGFSFFKKDKPVDEKVIQADAEALVEKEGFQVETKEFEVIKRQTNMDDKEDLVYVYLYGENEDIAVSRCYKFTYILYNDGWLLEENEPYIDEERPDGTVPLHGPTEEDAIEYIDSYGLKSFASFRSSIAHAEMLEDIDHPEWAYSVWGPTAEALDLTVEADYSSLYGDEEYADYYSDSGLYLDDVGEYDAGEANAADSDYYVADPSEGGYFGPSMYDENGTFTGSEYVGGFDSGYEGSYDSGYTGPGCEAYDQFTFHLVFQYEVPLEEDVDVCVSYNFNTYTGAWEPSLMDWDTNRSLKLTQDLAGSWDSRAHYDDTFDERHSGDETFADSHVDVLSVDENGQGCTFQNYWYYREYDPLYAPLSQDVDNPDHRATHPDGHLTLNYEYYYGEDEYDVGKINDIELLWDDDGNESNIKFWCDRDEGTVKFVNEHFDLHYVYVGMKKTS